MSVLHYQETIDSDLQIWNNAAYDNGEISEDLTSSRQSWGSLKSIFGNPKSSFDSVSDKENQGFVLENQISSVSSSLKSTDTPFMPINSDGLIPKSRIEGVSKKGCNKNVDSIKVCDEKKIDEEIEEIESQISNLSSRLEALRLEKAVMKAKVIQKRGRVVPAKFMDQKVTEEVISSVSARTRNAQRRGISLGPAEIISGGGRRGMSMGPTEIFGAGKSRQMGKQELLATPIQSRRKSCFMKLQDIDEEKVVAKERGKSSSLSPKSRKHAAKNQVLSRQAVTTIASRKISKKDDLVINSIQPKKLFKEGEKSGPATSKKPLRPGRVVASRYNQNASQQASSAMRKRSLPENDNDYSNKRALSVGKSRVNANEDKNLLGSESRVKKRWEIPSEIVVCGSGGEAESIVVVPDLLLPRIKIARCTKESPRDSGPAKKVVELIGRKSFFSNDEESEPSVCQALTYAEDKEGVEDFLITEQ